MNQVEAVKWPMTILELDDELFARNVVILTNILKSSRAWPDFQIYRTVVIRSPAKNMKFLLCASGTTGLGKGVVLSHRNMILQDLALREPEFLRFKPTDVLLSILPYSAYDMSLVISQFHDDATAITMTSYQPEVYLNMIGKHRVMMLVPPMISFRTKNHISSCCEYSSLENIIRGTSCISPVVRPNVWKRLGNPDYRIKYENAELSRGFSKTKRHTKKTDGVHYLIPGVSCKIIHQETSRSFGTRKTEKKRFTGHTNNYLTNPDVTMKAIDRKGWLHARNFGYYDEYGDFFIVGRRKELITYKAFPVSRKEILRLIVSHPNVMYAAAVSIPNDDAGESFMAFIVKIPNSMVTAKEICEFVNEQITLHDEIRVGEYYVNIIPKTSAGKIIRRQLLNMSSKL